jgi:hypothetical protein
MISRKTCGTISDKCLVKMFRQWCLYQCDPYLEKWVVNYTVPDQPTTHVTATTQSTVNMSFYDIDKGACH